MEKKLFTISEKEYTPVEQPGKTEFSKYIDIFKNRYSKYGMRVRTRTIANWVGIDYEQFRKIVNKTRQTNKRDCIIAICICLELNIDETNEALRLYNNMLPLNENYPRDQEIMNILDEQKQYYRSLEQINKQLTQMGFPELDIRNNTSKAEKKSSSPYKVISKKVKSQIDDMWFGDPYQTMATEYHPIRLSASAEMWIKEPVGKKHYRLVASDRGAMFIEGVASSDNLLICFNSIEETDDYKDFFCELKAMAVAELKQQLSRLDDTRNYYTRKSARVIDNGIHVFIERYNYQIPELGEYHLMDYCDGVFSLYISRSSLFMKKYLSPKEYADYFGKEKRETPIVYRSEEELIQNVTDKDVILEMYLRTYQKMKNELIPFIKDLKDKKIKILDAESIFGEPYEILRFFHVEEEFDCCYDEEFGVITDVGIKEAPITLEDGRTRTLSIDELRAAFEIGMTTMTEVFDFLEARHTLNISELL